MSRAEIVICPDSDALAQRAADQFVSAADEACARRGRFAVALSGGSTPKMLYDRLAAPAFARRLEWQQMHFFWGDERCVPPDHPESNFRMAREALLDKVAVPSANIHRMSGEGNPEAAADAYQGEIKRFFLLEGGELPRFDLILLGLGEDGHTASLFPASAALDEHERLVAAPYVGKLQAHRLTLTLPVINAASHVIFLVAGASKAKVVREILAGSGAGAGYPAARVMPTDGKLQWLIDVAAAMELRLPSENGGVA